VHGACEHAGVSDWEVPARPEPPAAPPADLRAQVVSGIGWKVATQVVVQVTRIVVLVLLARLLSPHDYGVAAVALMYVGVATIFTDISLGYALIQRPAITEHDRSTAFWTTVAAGVVCAVASVSGASLIARAFGTPDASSLIAGASVLFLIAAAGSTQNALLTRELRFRSLELREMAAAVVGGAAGISLAAAGAGAWALVLQVVAAETTALVLVWRFSDWRPRLTYSRASLRDLGTFGAKASGSRLLGYLNLNADNFLIARFLGAAPLGVYSVAWNVMFAPFARLVSPIQQVLFPAFARLRDPGRIGGAWLRGNRMVAAIALPAFVGLAVVAHDFVTVVLGERWLGAVPVLQVLCVAGAAQSLQSLNHSALQGLDRAGRLLAFMTFSTAVTLTSFAVGLHWGVVGVAAGFATARTLVLPVFTTIVCRAAGLGPGSYVRSLHRVAEAAAAMGLVAWGVREVLAGAPDTARLAGVVAAGAVSYLALLRWREPELVREVVGLVRRRPA
jgi:O-antigen/teichoic acid export membrane protein